MYELGPDLDPGFPYDPDQDNNQVLVRIHSPVHAGDQDVGRGFVPVIAQEPESTKYFTLFRVENSMVCPF